MSVRETVRQNVVSQAPEWMERTFGDFRWQVYAAARGVKGEERIGFALGLLNAIETMALRENE